MRKKITALKAQKKNKNRVNVYLDGQFAFGLSRIVAAWLQVGQELDEAKITELANQENQETAYQRALRFLSYRPRSETEVRNLLKKYVDDEQVISQIIDRLRRIDLVDDQKFAQTWVSNRTEFRPRGRRALTYELRQKNVSPEIIDQVLTDLDEDALAYQAAVKHARKLKNQDWQAFRRKLSGFLSRRGFHYEIIHSTVQRIWSEREEGFPE